MTDGSVGEMNLWNRISKVYYLKWSEVRGSSTSFRKGEEFG